MNSAPGGEEQRGFNLVAQVEVLQPEFTLTCAGRNWPQGQVKARGIARAVVTTCPDTSVADMQDRLNAYPT